MHFLLSEPQNYPVISFFTQNPEKCVAIHVQLSIYYLSRLPDQKVATENSSN